MAPPHVIVPFSGADPKTRLEPLLSAAERGRLARAMLSDVLAAVSGAGAESTVLATEPVDADLAERVIVDERPLSAAVNARLESEGPVAVVMADLALATPEALEGLFATDGEVVVAPGRGGGTNALVVRHPDFSVDYHGVSYLDHRERAREVGAVVETVDSFRLATDVDEPEDVVEVLVHGDGESRDALEGMGFEIAVRDGRVGVARR
ncbi:2-phospho-L-lactate guanylyltransferase [Saliphagus infecundisoli]|uniref:2-phospho-L-lactate guanylyltransferase n=1 Tax=Saliphagus infecundisoli TaxID=1849069 RepID=A0ABD5QBI6_9EURY|nr:2-phospho-L-lactate guanylyltransferase [Saliphagus infecundisoli]